MKNGKYKLDANQIRQICLGLARGKSFRAISRQTGLSINRVNRTAGRIQAVSGGKPEELVNLDDHQLLGRIYSTETSSIENYADSVKGSKYIPDFEHIVSGLIVEKRMSVIETYRWYEEQCKKQNAEQLSQAYFYKIVNEELEKLHLKTPEYYMMREHAYGEEIQVDFTGDTYMVQTFNGKIRCWIMVLSFPASYYTYGGFVTSQSTAETCRVIGEAVKYFGNLAPDLLYCDNAAAMVTSHKGTSIVFNKNFLHFMTGLGVAVDAAPPRCPQHKSCVEESVKLVEKRVGKNELFIRGLADVRTLSAHNVILQDYIEREINKKEFRKDAVKTRAFLFNTYEKPKLNRVRHIPEYIDDIRSMCVPGSYHLSINEHWYSVPYQYIKSYVDVFVTNDRITVKYRGAVIAEHQRCDGMDQLRGTNKTTLLEHMPHVHKKSVTRSVRFDSEESVLECAKALDEGVYIFCQNRLRFAQNDGIKYLANAKSSCGAVIDFYNAELNKSLVSEACRYVISSLEPRYWNKQSVVEQYRHLLQLEQERKNSQSTSAGRPKLVKVEPGDYYSNETPPVEPELPEL